MGFERGQDEYDTMLGNTAVDEEIACHININVIAEYDYENPNPPNDSDKGGKDISWTSIKTGDAQAYIRYLIIGVVCVAVVVLLLIVFRNKEDEKRIKNKSYGKGVENYFKNALLCPDINSYWTECVLYKCQTCSP